MLFTICENVTLETTDAVLCHVLSVCQHVQAVCVQYQTMPYDEVKDDCRTELYDLMDYVNYNDSYEPYYDFVWECYYRYNCAYDTAYYNYAIDDFLEYESHMDEPDFDWGFYSDWHKDLYGFRPH